MTAYRSLATKSTIVGTEIMAVLGDSSGDYNTSPNQMKAFYLTNSALTGAPTAPTPATSANSTQIPTCAWVISYVAANPGSGGGTGTLPSMAPNTVLAGPATGSTNATAAARQLVANDFGAVIDFSGKTEVKVPAPANPLDAVTKNYVDTAVSGVASGALPPNVVTATTYTLVAGDNGKDIYCTNNTSCSITFPTGVAARGFKCLIYRDVGAGPVTPVQGTGASLVPTDNLSASAPIAAPGKAMFVAGSTGDTFFIGGGRS